MRQGIFMHRYKKILEAAMTVFILVGSFYIGKYSAVMVESTQIIDKKSILQNKTIVIDCGHGGFDSGKVGINEALEKDVNLAIGEKLCSLLEANGNQVIMTRQDDMGLYDEEEENKKQQDMKRRVQMINESEADLAVSIHQNSYTEEYVNGPQVFFYETSVKAKELANILQQNLNMKLQIERTREIKGNTTYYLLCKTKIPTVIVECGFLSNEKEAEKLVDPEYQQQVAEAICCGIEEYVSVEEK